MGLRDGIRFRDEQTQWLVTPERLEIVGPVQRCSELAIRVLHDLPHTPMTATLSVFSFDLEPSPGPPRSSIFETIRRSVPRELTLDMTRWGIAFNHDDVRIDLVFLQSEQSRSTVSVSTTHRRSSGNAEVASKAAERIADDLKQSRKLIERFCSLTD